MEIGWMGPPRTLRQQQSRTCPNWLANKVYDDLDDLVADVKEWITSKNSNFFARGIDRLPSKWEAVIEVDGEYAPE